MSLEGLNDQRNHSSPGLLYAKGRAWLNLDY